MIVMLITDILSVSGSVANQEQLLDRALSPLHLKSVVETALNIFGGIPAAHRAHSRDKLYTCVKVLRQLKYLKSGFVLDISVADKANAHSQIFAFALYLLNDLLKGRLASIDPR